VDIGVNVKVLASRHLSTDDFRRATPVLSDGPVRPLPPLESLKNAPKVPAPTDASPYPFENLAFEGGGAKGYAYIGAIQVLEEAGIYPDQVRRVAGTSVGSMIAMMAALGCDSSYMLSKTPKDLQGLVMDCSGGKAGSILHAALTRGLHPGKRVFDFIGEVLEDVTGSADITFAQLLQRYGRELCVPVTNVTRMTTEYCHPKTTPNMSVRVGVRMSMSLPVLLQPVLLTKASQESADPPEVYVDGGLLCNNPTHAFDGWWLSMTHEDAFLRRLQPLADAHDHYPRSERFSPSNPKTLGFTVFASSDTDITRDWVRAGGEPPRRPKTPAALRCNALERQKDKQSRLNAPLQHLMGVIDDFDVDRDGRIDQAELKAMIDSGGMSDSDLLSIFGTVNANEIYEALDQDSVGTIEYGELLSFLESHDVDVTTQLVGFPARAPKTSIEFLLNMLEAMTRDLTLANHNPLDRARTVPINTDYVGTQTFDLEQADLDFLVEVARRSTKAFLIEFDTLARSTSESAVRIPSDQVSAEHPA